MKCRRVRRQLVALLDDELAPSVATRMTDHLADCESCQTALERLAASTPEAPHLDLDDGELHAIQLQILRGLDEVEDAPAPPARPAQGSVFQLFASDIRMPRGLVVLYAAAFVAVLGWAASSTLPSGSATLPTAQSDVVSSARAADAHRPAAYTPEDGWF